jgi:uncharacterized protein YqiB (DUF1249 family)
LRDDASENAVSYKISEKPLPLEIVHAVRYTFLEKLTRTAVPWRRLSRPEEHEG